MVPSKDLLLDKGAEEGHAFHETFATIEEPADERLGIERWNRNCILLVEEEHSVSVDLRDEELVGGRRFQHREIDEEEFGRPLQAVESLGNPRPRGPRNLMPDLDWREGGQSLLYDLERCRDHSVVDDDVEVDIGPLVDSIECGGPALPKRVHVGELSKILRHRLDDRLPR